MSRNDELPQVVQSSWTDFLAVYEPLRPELFRYCRHLTRSPWDAEDLVQDSLARAFVTLGQMGASPPNPRAWLFRVASNLWIDRTRKSRREDIRDADAAVEGSDPRATREAAATLLGQLSPQERAAVVLKDIFDLSLEETADALGTTIGAVKIALHRARGKLVEEPPTFAAVPAPKVLDAFCAAFQAGDIDRLAALLLDNASVQVVGATTQYGPEAARRTVLYGMLNGHSLLAAGDPMCGITPELVQRAVDQRPRLEPRAHRGEWVLLHWYAHEDGEFVRAVTRIDADGDRIARLRNHFYDPSLLAEVCGELEVPFRVNGYRWCQRSR